VKKAVLLAAAIGLAILAWLSFTYKDAFDPTAAPRPDMPPPVPVPLQLSDNMAVYAEPDFEAAVIGEARDVENPAITGRDSAGNWWRIDYNGEIGWIYTEAVSGHTRLMDDVPITAPGAVPEIEIWTGSEAAGGTILFARPSKNIDVERLIHFFRAEQITLIGRHKSPGWYLTAWRGRPAWLFVNETPEQKLILKGLPLKTEEEAAAMIQRARETPAPPAP